MEIAFEFCTLEQNQNLNIMRNFISNIGIIVILIAVILLFIYMSMGLVNNALLGTALLLLVGGIATYVITNRIYNG